MCLGIPAQIVSVDEHNAHQAMVDIAGVTRQVNIACVLSDVEHPRQLIGTWVLLHVGFAMSRINESEALHTLQLLEQFSDTDFEKDDGHAIR
ncbi:HypC/HybG/HupF family hydrogenase formation chaperone [Aestuariibacter salexigens]|uniref:HypC/HybG/HupF family hydrogenase formation chaperone n=1 Tax=Aestuariibacter salexigens TaxID=226010 RepID=UPI0003FFE3FA|nr:HypC/HybG/HupF family hydrogenase formation chaperone [Aestuariibacter salexigens]